MNNFRKEEYFFVIDSESLDNVKSHLYGFSIVDSSVVTNDNLNGRELSGEGSYVNIIRNEDRIVIQQDSMGSQGLYFFLKEGYFAISNSFWMLADRVKTVSKLSLNKRCTDASLSRGICTYSFSDTLINEITRLDRSIEVHIDIKSKTAKTNMCPLVENTVDLDTKEGMGLLDHWYEKWTNLIHDLISDGDSVTADLSGGFDTRIVFTLFLHPDINLGKIRINSNSDKLYTHPEDFKIASQIAEKYGFVLNKDCNNAVKSSNNTVEDILNIAFYNKLGFHKEMQWKFKKSIPGDYQFSGSGGATIRGGYCSKQSELISNELNKAKDIPWPIDETVSESVENIVEDACRLTVDKYRNAGRELSDDEFTRFMYRETRNAVHFGKSIYDSYLGSRYKMCPLLDPDFQKLKLYSGDCLDADLLMALVFIRYGRGIIDFPIQGGRSIKPDTIAYAESINNKYPYDFKKISEKTARTVRTVNDSVNLSENPSVDKKQVFDKVEDIFYSYEIKDTIEKLYGKKLYKYICYAITNTGYHKYSLAYASIAIYLADKAVQESNGVETDKYEDSISSLFSLRQIAQDKRYRPKNNIYRKALRFFERKILKKIK
ncbi:hypothetical protein [Butyrivibrio sp. WCD3002]|uniref:hypothetical protein n=1 Tax=Butyrivibrio sp. WCD3002 TaxID=1280676 RepID=UPI0004107781|nr:hypothetical protein [Butyrivibrio sp. WCD3002]